MSGFFSLGGKEQQEEEEDEENNNSLFLIKNEEIYNKGFELWQQYYQLHQQRLHLHHNLQLDHMSFPVEPTSRSNIVDDDDDDERLVKVQGRGGGKEGMNCQDCGNQAKKDCLHFRCRTCCKARGFHCQTHVKSTWVPAAKRRERQQQLQLRENQRGGAAAGAASSSSGFEMGRFPAEVNSPAVFRCVRVSAVDDDMEEHLAYHTAVNIGGHVFKGILYDQGPESESSAAQQAVVTAAMVEYPSVTPTPLTAFMAGTQFFPPPRP